MERFIGRGKEGGEEDKEEEEVVVLHSICLKIREKRKGKNTRRRKDDRVTPISAGPSTRRMWKKEGEEGKKANDRYIRNIVSDTRAIFSNELFESIIRRKI